MADLAVMRAISTYRKIKTEKTIFLDNLADELAALDAQQVDYGRLASDLAAIVLKNVGVSLPEPLVRKQSDYFAYIGAIEKTLENTLFSALGGKFKEGQKVKIVKNFGGERGKRKREYFYGGDTFDVRLNTIGTVMSCAGNEMQVELQNASHERVIWKFHPNELTPVINTEKLKREIAGHGFNNNVKKLDEALRASGTEINHFEVGDNVRLAKVLGGYNTNTYYYGTKRTRVPLGTVGTILEKVDDVITVRTKYGRYGFHATEITHIYAAEEITLAKQNIRLAARSVVRKHAADLEMRAGLTTQENTRNEVIRRGISQMLSCDFTKREILGFFKKLAYDEKLVKTALEELT